MGRSGQAGEGKEDRGGREGTGTGKRTRKSRTGARRKKSRAGGQKEEEQEDRRKQGRRGA